MHNRQQDDKAELQVFMKPFYEAVSGIAESRRRKPKRLAAGMPSTVVDRYYSECR
jgi:hypothetical protein